VADTRDLIIDKIITLSLRSWIPWLNVPPFQLHYHHDPALLLLTRSEMSSSSASMASSSRPAHRGLWPLRGRGFYKADAGYPLNCSARSGSDPLDLPNSVTCPLATQCDGRAGGLCSSSGSRHGTVSTLEGGEGERGEIHRRSAVKAGRGKKV
jgi:hypothetical protein